MNANVRYLVAVSIFSTLANLGMAQDFEFSASAGWESSYVSEGRENLESGGIYSADFVLVDSDWEFGALFAEADTVQYGERNWWVATTRRIAAIDATLGWTYLEFTEDGSHDTELSVEMVGMVFSEFEFGGGIVYSKESDGYFFEGFISREYRWSEGMWFLPYVALSANSGYVAGEPNGLSHFQFGASLNQRITERIDLETFVNVSFGIADGVDDLVWAGLRLHL